MNALYVLLFSAACSGSDPETTYPSSDGPMGVGFSNESKSDDDDTSPDTGGEGQDTGSNDTGSTGTESS